MTDWPPDVVDRLTDEARQKGLTLDDYVLQSVLQSHGDAAKLRARQDAGRSIRELRKGTVLGSDLTIRDLTKEGRRF